MKFSKAQTTAILHRNGPMLVLAGPGSGKTAVITKRTGTLIDTYGVPPHRILVITFTRAAAGEMRERFLRERQGVYTPVRFGTFHSVFFLILKNAYHYQAGSILSESRKKQILREILSGLQLELPDEAEFLSSLTGELSLIKNEGIPLSHYYPVNCSQEVFARFYEAYESRLRQSRMLDFDDILVYCHELLTKRPDILARWQEQFSYILVDEFQDINRLQYEVVKMLAKPEDNLFAVGDDDQSIYRFRGAKPEIMRKFSEDYKNAARVVLDLNYRSTENIVEAAERVIQNNKTRFVKKIKAAGPKGGPVVIRRFPDLAGENRTLMEEILKLRRGGVPFGEIAVLFRTNTQPRALLGKLMEYNIPFSMKDAAPNLYEHWIAGDLTAYVRLAAGRRERGLFLRIMNRPVRYLSRECVDTEQVDLERLRMYYEDKRWMIERIDRLEYDLAALSRMVPYAAVKYIRRGIGYDDFIREYAQTRNMDENELYERLDELQELSREYQTFEEWFAHMERYGEELKRQNRELRQTGQDAVALATMHGSKGLEYRAVFLIDVNEGVMPHKKAVLDADLEEERRMFYVAMTRAKELLFLYCVRQRYNKELAPSRFLTELGWKPDGGTK